jgi:hypothetical protein
MRSKEEILAVLQMLEGGLQCTQGQDYAAFDLALHGLCEGDAELAASVKYVLYPHISNLRPIDWVVDAIAALKR